jgi:hypothetical protein
MKKTVITLLSITALCGCVTPAQWQANQYHDEFTNQSTCRVEMGDAHQRQFGRAMSGTYFSYNFFAEKYDGEIRVGVRSQPIIPISGDVQIKVGDTLYVMTTADTPLDIKMAVSTPQGTDEFSKNYAQAMEMMQKFSSPYRAYTGKKAKALIDDILNTGGEIKFRTIGINAATSGTGSFILDENFKTALHECGITEMSSK